MTDTEVLEVLGFRGGFYDSDKLTAPQDALAPGSENYFVTADNSLRAFRGMSLNANVKGGRQMFTVAGGYASLNDYTSGSTIQGNGSVFNYINETLWYVGAGQVFYNGKSLYKENGTGGITASDATLTLSDTADAEFAATDVGSQITIVGAGASGADLVTTILSFTSTSEVELSDTAPTTVSSVNVTWNVDFRASSTLSLSIKNGTTYTKGYTAGLAQPSTVTVASKDAGVGFTGLLDGVFSFKIARIRSTTGGRSIASTASAVIECENQTARLTFPALDANGQDRWAIFATKSGFGGVGVHYLVEEISDSDLSTIDSIARSYELEFNDSDLLPIVAYTEDYPPPACSFGGRLENYVLAIGCYDNAIASSIRNFPESFDPEHLGFLPQSPTAVLPDQIGSYLYVATENSVHAVSITFAENPLAIQTVWSDTGIKKPHNWCVVQGQIFAFVSEQGAVTMDALGNPSNIFALPVSNTMNSWDVDNTQVFHAPNLNSVIFCNSGEAYAFNYQNRKWSSPADVAAFASGTVVSGVVVDRTLKMTIVGLGSSFDLYDFDTNNGSDNTICVAQSHDFSNKVGRINLMGIKGAYQASDAGSATFQLKTDYGNGGAKTLTDTGSVGTNTTIQTRWGGSLPRKEAFSVRFQQTVSTYTNDAYPIFTAVYGTPEMSNKL